MDYLHECALQNKINSQEKMIDDISIIVKDYRFGLDYHTMCEMIVNIIDILNKGGIE